MIIKKFKLFESNTDDFYKEITEREFDEHYDIDGIEDYFTNKEIDYIKSLFPKEYLVKLNIPDSITIGNGHDFQNLLSINKLKDQWFLIVSFDKELKYFKYYKCDQLDGLEKCIKEKCIKKFQKFIESISGTELMGDVGPSYGKEKLPTTINQGDTNVLYSELTDKFYTEDDFQDLYQDYLKKGGKPLTSGFNKENLDGILITLNP